MSVLYDRAIHRRSERVELMYRDEPPGAGYWETLENLRESVLNGSGQYISLDLADPLTVSPWESFYVALKNARWETSLQFSLPVVLQHNPRIASPFINRAVLWQRLCDLLLLDEEPARETVLVLENVDQASPDQQHDVARLIRFHEKHDIRRTFVFTLEKCPLEPIIPELRTLLEI